MKMKCVICLKNMNDMTIELGEYYNCGCLEKFYCVECFMGLYYREIGRRCPTCRTEKTGDKFDVKFLKVEGLNCKFQISSNSNINFPIDLKFIESFVEKKIIV